jgi:hypothetical protein
MGAFWRFDAYFYVLRFIRLLEIAPRILGRCSYTFGRRFRNLAARARLVPMSEYDVEIPDESEQLDQLQPDETLVDRGVDDVLDEGYTAPERWSAAEGYGNTAYEQSQGETLDQRLAQEEPDVTDADWDDDSDSDSDEEVGDLRAGRLVDALGGYADEDGDDGDVGPSDVLGGDVGLSGGAASAEEAAMHIID